MDGHTFRLPNGHTASYEWGSHAIRLSPGMSLGREDVPTMLAALTGGRAHWPDDDAFARHVAVLHECAHCLQDLTTGVGLWDFFLGLERLPGVLEELRVASWGTPFGTPLPSGSAPRYGQWLDDGFLPQSEAARRRRQAHLRERLAVDPNVGGVDDVERFSIDRLLEADAVVQVHLSLQRLDMTHDEQQVMRRHRPLWSAPHMAHAYQGVYHDVIDVARGWAQADGRPPDEATVSSAMVVTAFLVELSLAHPSPAWLADRGQDPLDHDPGLKFVLLLSALSGLPTAEHEACMRALSRGDVAEAERVVLARCALAYAPSETVYRDWLTHLEALPPQSGNAIVELRLRALRQRLRHPERHLLKSMTTFFASGLPLVILAEGGFRLTSTDPHYILGDARFELIADIVREQATRRFVISTGEGVPFVCSHAEFGVCGARTAVCSAGLSHADAFPPAAGCTMRSWADASAWGGFRAVRRS